MSDLRNVTARVSPELADLVEYLAYSYRLTRSDVLNVLLDIAFEGMTASELAEMLLDKSRLQREQTMTVIDRVNRYRASLEEA